MKTRTHIAIIIILTAALLSTGAYFLWPSVVTVFTAQSTPKQVVEAYYDWYFGYISKSNDGEFRNPLVDRAYRDSQFLRSGFIASVDEMLSKETLGGFDPFLLAQDIPSDFSVDPGPTEDSAVVHLQFGESMTRHIRLLFVKENGSLLISSIEEDIR